MGGPPHVTPPPFWGGFEEPTGLLVQLGEPSCFLGMVNSPEDPEFLPFTDLIGNSIRTISWDKKWGPPLKPPRDCLQ